MKAFPAFAASIALALPFPSQQGPPPLQPPPPPIKAGNVEATRVKGNVYLVAGISVANVTLQVGEDGVFVVDTGVASAAADVISVIKQLTAKPILWIVNTSANPDHSDGNEALARAGRAVAQNDLTGQPRLFSNEGAGATIVAHEKVLARMSAPTGERPPRPVAGWPSITYFEEQREMYLNDEPILVIHQPAAITDGDSIVFFRRSDVISAGSVYANNAYPVIDVSAGGTIDGEIAALNTILDIAIAKEKAEGGTYIIPGRGRLADEADVFAYRNMVVMIRDRVAAMKRKDMSLDQINAAKPALDYDARYSIASWTSDMFVEAIYRTLPPAPSATR